MDFDAVLDKLDVKRRTSKGGALARCPAHEDRVASLSVDVGTDGRTLLRCFAGCTSEDIVAAVGLDLKDLFTGDSDADLPQLVTRKPNATRYEMRDADGALIAVHKRVDHGDGSKEFFWQQPDGQPGLNGTQAKDLPLYGAHRLPEWPDTVPLVLVEGEKSADALVAVGVPALATVSGAAVTPGRQPLSVLRGRSVLLWPDADTAGRSHMRSVAELLSEVAAVGWVTWPEAPAKGDAHDFLAAGASADDVRALLDTATDAASIADERNESNEESRPAERVSSSISFVSSASLAATWPEPLAPEAFQGLAGRLVAAAEPWSEADPAAILLQSLSAFSAAAGAGVHAMAGDRFHPARIWTVTVGATGKGRKDTAGQPGLRVVALADRDFAARVVEGLSSGEGVIHAVRDATEKIVQVGRGDERHPEPQLVDEGVADKRLFVRESEFASVLRAVMREGNTLSPTMRRAWDAGPDDVLRTLTKNSPSAATGAHIVISGNVTRDELLRYLDRTEAASGFMNRFLLCAARRAQILPDGEGVPLESLLPLADELRAVVEWARTPRLVQRDDEARNKWHNVYEELSAGAPGLYGAATGRAEAQTLRLSLLYAILDRSEEVTVRHLDAALAVWKYAAASAKWVFGDAIGDTVADTILAALRSRGSISRTDISNLFGRNAERSRIERALAELELLGRARHTKEDSGGRPKEVWHAA